MNEHVPIVSFRKHFRFVRNAFVNRSPRHGMWSTIRQRCWSSILFYFSRFFGYFSLSIRISMPISGFVSKHRKENIDCTSKTTKSYSNCTIYHITYPNIFLKNMCQTNSFSNKSFHPFIQLKNFSIESITLL